MKINLAEYIPESIDNKKIVISLSGEKAIGRKIENFEGKIKEIKIKKVDKKENPRLKILKALSKKDMTYEELIKKTGLSHENLRWYILRNKRSLSKEGLVIIKERKTFLYKHANGGCVRIIFSITDKGKSEISSMKKKIKLPKRKGLTLITSKNEEIILSSWWSSWLKPRIKDLRYDNNENKFVWKIPKNYILVQYEKTKGNLYSTILPKQIEINDEIFVTSLGLLLGEMRKRKGEVTFSNTEHFLIEYVLRFFEYFGMSRNMFSYDIQINTKNSKPNQTKLRDYWSKKLDVNISKIYEYPDYGTNRSKYGRIDFRFHNIILKEIINNLISNFIKEAHKNKDYAIYLLRGLLAAEGYVSASRVGSLGRVAISSNSEKDKEILIKILKNLDINSSIKSNCICITSKNNFNKIIEYDLLKISKDKDKFKKLYNNFKYKKSELISF